MNNRIEDRTHLCVGDWCEVNSKAEYENLYKALATSKLENWVISNSCFVVGNIGTARNQKIPYQDVFDEIFLVIRKNTMNLYQQALEEKEVGRPNKPPRKKFPVDIDEATLIKAKEKYPKLHSMVVNYIRELSESDPLEGEEHF